MSNLKFNFYYFFILVAFLTGCTVKKDTAVLTHDSASVSKIVDTSMPIFNVPDSPQKLFPVHVDSFSRFKADPASVVAFAKTLIGVPYKYGSTNPAEGFDCSGFITYVFNYFKMQVPRSSVDFTNYGLAIPTNEAKEGDLILFTGTNPMERIVGHMGIVVGNTDSLRFIHSTSGKMNSVTISTLNSYYVERFVKTIRVFE